MNPSEAKNYIAILPGEVLAIVTSYLGSSALSAFLRASNKILRTKLRRDGVQALHVLEMDEQERQAPFSQEQLFSAQPQFPWLVDYNEKCHLHFLPPINFFHNLQTLSFTLHKTSLPGGQLSLACLPPTLTYLEWTAPVGIWRTNDGLSMKTALPNLLHLGFRDSRIGFHAPHAKHILPNLPEGLLSLRVQVSFADQIIRTCSHLLPPNLTHLGVFESGPQGRLQFRYLDSASLKSKLPSSITNLQLHSYRWEVEEHVFELVGLKITVLHLHSIDFEIRAYLPMTLTRLLLVHDQVPYRRDQKPVWPERLESIVIGRSSTFVLPCSPSVTRLKISEPMSEVNLNPRYDPEIGPFEFVTPALKFLELPQATMVEAMLAFLPPSLTHVSLQEVLMDGSSLPKDLTHLDDIQQMNECFWKVTRSYHLLLRHPSYPKSIARYRFKVPTKKLMSLKIGADYLQKLPKGLTRLANFTLSNNSIHQLPTGLTSLHFFQAPNSSGISIESLLHRLPRLKTLKSSLRSADQPELISGAVLLESCHFPTTTAASAQPPPSSTSSSLSSSSSSSQFSPILPTLTLPDDAIQVLKRTHASTLKFKGVWFDQFDLLRSVSNISASHATFAGEYRVSESLMQNGFSPGLTVLDLTEGKLVFDTNNGALGIGVPPLPDTIREVRFGGELATLVSLDPTNIILPPTLAKLVLTLTKCPFSTKNLASRSPPGLFHLELRTSSPYTSQQISCFYSRFSSVEVSAAGAVNILVASNHHEASTQAKCSVM